MREWICWDSETASENTSTLVLTSPANSFVDIRLLLPAPHPVANTSQPLPQPPLLPNTGGPFDRLDWAFAGASESLPPTTTPLARVQPASVYGPLLPVDVSAFGGGGGEAVRVPRKRWRHVVDSRCAYGEEPAPDEGDMYPVLHAPERCLEIGRMERIKGSGVAVGYQELWVSLEAMPVGGESLRRGVVLSLDVPEQKARGSIVRVAQFVQGLLMIGDEVTVERWEYSVTPQGSGPKWQRLAKLGSRFLPCAWTFEGGQAIVEETLLGSELVDGEMRWTLQERFEW